MNTDVLDDDGRSLARTAQTQSVLVRNPDYYGLYKDETYRALWVCLRCKHWIET